jgi:hypothetical protein
MKRLLVSMVLGIVCLLLGAGAGSAQEKPETIAQQRYDATLSPGFGGLTTLSVSIEEVSPDAELHDLARTFIKGGAGALENALGKMKEGYFRLGDGVNRPIRVAMLSSAGGVRNLTIIADAEDHIQSTFGRDIIVGHEGYPYAFIKIEVNQKGKGKGLIVPFAKIVFNQLGQMNVKPMKAQAGATSIAHLVDVHLVK